MKSPTCDEPAAGSSILTRRVNEYEAMRLPFRLACQPPLLTVRFDEPVDTVGWSLLNPGFASGREIVWLEVHDGDLPIDVDPIAFLKEKLAANGLDEAAAFMTSRDIRRHHVTQSAIGEVIATCVTTVGLSNAERVGTRRRSHVHAFGTINTLIHVSRPLSQGTFVEAVSIATQARTAAVMEACDRPEAAPVTGTGTDCIIVAAPKGDRPESCVGLHTDLGEAIGAAVYDATFAGATEWSAETTTCEGTQ
jgi:adenosylcobinamide amidohydrolase